MSNNQNLLFICSRNQWRSPTAESVFKRKGFSARSAGTSPKAKRTLSQTDLQWADVIFVMESKHRDRVKAKFDHLIEHKPIHVLDVLDEYRYMDPELVSMLEQAVKPYLSSAS